MSSPSHKLGCLLYLPDTGPKALQARGQECKTAVASEPQFLERFVLGPCAQRSSQLTLRTPHSTCTSLSSPLQVVAPVRETAAQALGSAARGLPGSALQVLARHLAALVAQKEWGVRLAGLLGIKYVLAARLDQAGALLPAVLPAVLTGLKV